MTDWQIVQGDYGGTYRAKTDPDLDLNLSDCTATIKVFRGDTLLIEDKPETPMDVTYDAVNKYSYCDYTVLDGDFPAAAIIDDAITTWKVMVEFTKGDFKEHDLGFDWIVVPAPPSSS